MVMVAELKGQVVPVLIVQAKTLLLAVPIPVTVVLLSVFVVIVAIPL